MTINFFGFSLEEHEEIKFNALTKNNGNILDTPLFYTQHDKLSDIFNSISFLNF